MTHSRGWTSSSGVRSATLAAAIAPLVFVMGGGLAFAQSVFVSGSAFANIHRVGGTERASPVVQNDDLSDTTGGGGAAVGGFLGPHAVVQLELAFPGRIEKHFEPPQPLPPALPPSLATVTDLTQSTRHVTILGGYRTREKRRVSAALLGGVMFVAERTRVVSRLVILRPFPGPQPNLTPSDSTVRLYRIAPAFGFDLSVAVRSRLSVVPQIRIYRPVGSTLGTIGIWPGVSVRWTF